MSDIFISQDELDKLFSQSENKNKPTQPRSAINTNDILNKEHPSVDEIKVEIKEQHVSLSQSEVDALLKK